MRHASSGGQRAGDRTSTATTVWAQAGATAQISGTVRDSSGAVLPGVDVTATQTDTNFVRSTVTDASGIRPVQPAHRTVSPCRRLCPDSAPSSALESFCRSTLIPRSSIEMAIGELAETVSVEAATPLVETRSPAVGPGHRERAIEELPLNGRNPTDLIALAGAAVPQPALNATSRSMQGGTATARRRRVGVRRGLSARRRHAQQPVRQPQPAVPVSRRAAGVPGRDQHDDGEQRHALERLGQRR